MYTQSYNLTFTLTTGKRPYTLTPLPISFISTFNSLWSMYSLTLVLVFTVFTVPEENALAVSEVPLSEDTALRHF